MKPLIVANWKMNPQNLTEAKRLFNSIKRGIKKIRKVEVVICPPFVYLPYFLNSKFYIPNLKFGAQNCFWEEKGSFTGEISAKMLKNLGCQYVILGHSERERYLGETDEMTNKKIKAAISAKLNPILCIGETEKDYNPPTTLSPFERAPRKEGKTFQVLKKQIKKTLINLSTSQLSNLIIAYEPVWAVGTGTPCPPKEAKIGLFAIRKIISHLYDSSLGKKIKIIYGGSINSKIAKEYIQEAGFQGLLIGGASLKAQEFVEIAKKVSQT